MKGKQVGFSTIDEYIASCSKEIQPVMQELRATIRAAAPDAVEKISYQMPAFDQNGILVYFAAFKDHIGFFPTASGVQAFKKELTSYETTKGTIHFPNGTRVPLRLVARIVKYRVTENLKKAGAKASKRK